MFGTVLSVWLSVMSTFAPYEPLPRLREVARVVERTTDSPDEQALLLTVSLHETTWGRTGIPFGLSALHRSFTLEESAQQSLKILRRAWARCGGRVAETLGHYHHGGGCRADSYSTRESRTWSRLVLYYWARHAFGGGLGVRFR